MTKRNAQLSSLRKAKSLELWSGNDDENGDSDRENNAHYKLLKRPCVRQNASNIYMGCMQTLSSSIGAGSPSQFQRVRHAFQDVARTRSAEVVSLSKNTRDVNSFKPKISAIEECVLSTETEPLEQEKQTELDMLLNLLEDDTGKEHITKPKRKIPAQNYGYAQQLYNILETYEADYKFLKRAHSAGSIDGAEFVIENIEISFGVYMATVDSPTNAVHSKWKFFLNASWAQNLIVGNKLIAYLDQADINDALVIDNCAIFMQPNKIMPSK